MTLRLSVFPFSIASFLSICHFCTFDFLSMSILKFNTSPTYFSPSALPHYSSSPIFPFSLIFFLPPYPLPFSPIPLTPTSPSVFRHDLIHSSTIFPPLVPPPARPRSSPSTLVPLSHSLRSPLPNLRFHSLFAAPTLSFIFSVLESVPQFPDPFFCQNVLYLSFFSLP